MELFLGIHEDWLRWFTLQGELVLSAVELLERERQHAEQEKQRAEQEKQRAERLAVKLRALGIDPGEEDG